MPSRSDLPALLTGLMATLAGVGLARFAYTALLPSVIEAGWFDAGDAAYLGAANLLGYLVGALSAHALSERFLPRRVMAAAFAAIVLSFLLCAAPASFAWFFVWRFVSGVAGAILMVVGPSLALTATPLSRRKSVAALAFTGIGLGVLLSASLVPLLLGLSLTMAWLALGILCLIAGLAGGWGLARLPAAEAAATLDGDATDGWPKGAGIIVLLVITAYALDAVGFVPHTVFWVDHLAREQGLGTGPASLQWAVLGLGAVLGPLLAGEVARRVGWHSGLALAFLLKASAVALPLLGLGVIGWTLSSLLVGAMIPAIVALTSGRLAEVAGPSDHKRLWGRATAAFATAQAAAGYGMSWLYAAQGTSEPLFAFGSLALMGGLALLLVSRTAEGCLGQRSLPSWRP